MDQQQIFSSNSSSWWNKNSSFKPLHAFNVPRLKYIIDYTTKTFTNNIKILDLGCGGGILSYSLYAANLPNITLEITATDINTEAINQAQSYFNNNKIDTKNTLTFYNQDIDEINQKFDIIIASELLEHIPNYSHFISKIANLCKEDSLFFCTTINRNLKSLFLAKFMAEYILNLAPKGVHSFKDFIKPGELEKASNPYFKLINLSGISYNPFFNEAKLSNNIDINYICVFEKLKNIVKEA